MVVVEVERLWHFFHVCGVLSEMTGLHQDETTSVKACSREAPVGLS